MTTATGLSRRQRYASAAELIKKQSQIEARLWREFKAACRAFYGASRGDVIYEWLRRGEHDFGFFAEKLVGVVPLAWQMRVAVAMQDHRYIPVRGMNALGKTTGYALKHMWCSFYRKFTGPEWGAKEYRIIHLAPEEAQSLQAKTKITEFLEDRASEQMYRTSGGWDARPCLLTPFFEESKPDGIHQGFSILEGSASITYRPSTYKAKGSDGTDPSLFTFDELRHERYFEHVLNAIILARFLRVPHGRALFYFTPMGASVELITAFNRGVSGLPGDVDWHSIDLDDIRTANPSINEETVQRAERNIAKKYRGMVMAGRTMQPEGAKFSTESVDRAMIGTTEADWLDDLVGVRERAMARCETCQAIKRGEETQHLIGDARDRKLHPMVGFVDPASSSPTADTIACTIWDLQPPSFPRRWCEAVYVAELPTGTKVQRVGLQVALMSMLIWGTCGFDANTALGHAVMDEIAEFPTRDELFESKFFSDQHGAPGDDALKARLERMREALAPEPDVAPRETKKKDKDVDIDYLGGLLDLEVLGISFHLQTKLELTNYTRKDTGIKQDWVMVQAGAAWLAKGLLPDLDAERTRRRRGGVAAKPGGIEDDYLGLGDEQDAYFAMPGDIGESLDSFGGLGALEEGR